MHPPHHLHPLLEIAMRSAAVYIAMLVGLRLAGKRYAGQLSPHDFVLILLVSNAVQNAMVGENTSVHGGLVAAGTLIVLNLVITRFVLHNRRFSRLLAGSPTLLVHNGQMIEEHLAHECILPEELEAQIREHGFEGPEEVKSAIQEVDGSISVIGFGSQKEHKVPPLHGHRRRVTRRGFRPGG
jgi:uncharacterized membrane protein YcaP (DUF421 family)